MDLVMKEPPFKTMIKYINVDMYSLMFVVERNLSTFSCLLLSNNNQNWNKSYDINTKYNLNNRWQNNSIKSFQSISG